MAMPPRLFLLLAVLLAAAHAGDLVEDWTRATTHTVTSESQLRNAMLVNNAVIDVQNDIVHARGADASNGMRVVAGRTVYLFSSTGAKIHRASGSPCRRFMYVAGTLYLKDMWFYGACSGGSACGGSAIWIDTAGTVKALRTRFENSACFCNSGAAIKVKGTLDAEDCVFTNNNAVYWNGGALDIATGTAKVSGLNCAFVGNKAKGAGDSINKHGSATLNLQCTSRGSSAFSGAHCNNCANAPNCDGACNAGYDSNNNICSSGGSSFLPTTSPTDTATPDPTPSPTSALSPSISPTSTPSAPSPAPTPTSVPSSTPSPTNSSLLATPLSDAPSPAPTSAPSSSPTSTPTSAPTTSAVEQQEAAPFNYILAIAGVALVLVVGAFAFYLFRRRSRRVERPKEATPDLEVDVDTGSVAPAHSPEEGQPRRPSLLRTETAIERGWAVGAVPPRSETWKSLASLLHVGTARELGYGRDVREGGRYSKLVLCGAWQIEAPSREQKYRLECEDIQHKISLICKRAGSNLPSVTTKLDEVSRQFKFDASINEKMLLHGTRADSVEAILHGGLNERFSGGLFGKGAYLAEDAAKIDQYCTADSVGDGPGSLHDLLYTSLGLTHPGKVYYVFAVRAVLGYVVFTKDGKNSSGPHGIHPIFAAGDERELSLIPGVSPPTSYHSLVAEAGPASEGYKVARHREFVIFHSAQTMPAYLLAYRRE